MYAWQRCAEEFPSYPAVVSAWQMVHLVTEAIAEKSALIQACWCVPQVIQGLVRVRMMPWRWGKVAAAPGSVPTPVSRLPSLPLPLLPLAPLTDRQA